MSEKGTHCIQCGREKTVCDVNAWGLCNLCVENRIMERAACCNMMHHALKRGYIQPRTGCIQAHFVRERIEDEHSVLLRISEYIKFCPFCGKRIGVR
jgi:hypothetical protein